MPNILTAEPFTFAVDSALLSELGERLVSTVHVALAELVKNAYDADAHTVHVSIEPQSGSAPTVVVRDDGVGMTREQVRDYWMKIGTSNKVAQPTSLRYGRLKTGSKGVGRFACRRLGLSLRLTTTAEVSSVSGQKQIHTTEVEFDWRKFRPGIDVEAVKCDGQTTATPSRPSGTVLEISGGQVDEWQARGFSYLQRQLALLATNRETARPGFQIDPGFNVVLEAPGLESQPVDLRDAVIEASWGTLTAKVDVDGRAVLSLNAKGLGGTKKFVSKERFQRIPGAHLRVGILPSRKEEARKPDLLANYVLSELINEWGGIHIRFNGFRVFPYGDAGDDWLRIEADRGRRLGRPMGELFDFAGTLEGVDASRTLLNMLGMRNYFGQVEVTSAISQLTPRIDRQGFVENETYEELRRFARFALDWANIHRDHYIQLRENEQYEKAREALRPVLNLEGPKDEIVPKAATFLRGEIRRIVQRLPPTQRKETEQTLVRTVKAIETVSAASTKQLEHLRLLASASTLTLLFAHEVRTVIGTLGASSLRLEQLAGNLPDHKKEFLELSSQLREVKGRFDNLVSMTGIVGAFRRADNLLELHLKTAAERATRCFQLITENYGISIDQTAVPTDLVVGPMVEGELYTILINLLSNSIKSVIAAGGVARRIRIDASQTGKKVVIRIMDNGLGLSEDFFQEVFTPFISDPSGSLYDKLEEHANPEDASIFGTGSGLGLPIARDVARARGGDIRFVSPPDAWKACVEVELP
jgi:signal transduction histidine kinase